VSTFLDRPQSVLARRALFQVHPWLGVLTGLYIFVVCATGAVLVFRIDMQRAMHPALFTPRTAGSLADPVAVMKSVQKAYPDSRVSGVEAPTTSRPTYLAYATSGDRFVTLLLDPSVQNCWASCRNSRSSARFKTCTSICPAAAGAASSMAWAHSCYSACA
jgi:hypothetical protein